MITYIIYFSDGETLQDDFVSEEAFLDYCDELQSQEGLTIVDYDKISHESK